MGKIEATSVAGKHTGEVNVVIFDNDHLYSGGADGVINVWDKNLKFLREIPVHKDYSVMALAVNSHNQLYSSGCDGTLRNFRRPWSHDKNDILLQTVMDDVTCLYCVDDILYSGDDKGIVTKWYHNQVGCQYNVLEEVRSMAIEQTNLYTVRDLDVIITDIKSGMGSYTTKATVEGRAPLVLFGPVINDFDHSHHVKYLACATRDGKGIHLYENASPYKKIWTKENAHDMIINAIIATETAIYTAGYDGKVKKWTNLDGKEPKLADEVTVGKCINSICFANEKRLLEPPSCDFRRSSLQRTSDVPSVLPEVNKDDVVYTADADGLVKCIRFSNK